MRLNTFAQACILLLLSVAVYLPGMDGGFRFDDHPNIVQQRVFELSAAGDIPVVAFLLDENELPRLRSLSLLSFALDANLAGEVSASWMTRVNILWHAVNSILVLLLFRLILSQAADSRQLLQTSRNRLAMFAAVIWAVHPLMLSTVLFIVQRMTLLSSFWMLTGLLAYLALRSSDKPEMRKFVWVSLLAWPLAALSKEQGALLPLLFAVVEFILFSSKERDRSLRQFHSISLGLFVAVGAAYVALRWNWMLEIYAMRDFGPLERILTQGRVLWEYVNLILLPGIREMGLYHATPVTSSGLFSPMSTFLAILAWIGFFVAAVYARKKAPLFSLAVIFYLASQSAESSFVPLEMIFEHRVYIASAPILLAFVFYAYKWLASKPALGKTVPLSVIAAAFVVTLGFATAVRAWTWNDVLVHSWFETLHFPDSYRAQNQFGNLMSEYEEFSDGPEAAARRQMGLEALLKAADLDKGSIIPIMNYLMVYKRPDRSRDKELLDELEHRLATSHARIPWRPSIEAFILCRHNKECDVSADRMIVLLNTAINNPSFPKEDRWYLIAARSSLLCTEKERCDAAINDLERIVSLADGSPLWKLQLAHLVKKAGYPDRARRLANEVLNVPDDLGSHANALNLLEELEKPE